ncbi:PqqD family protein [Sphingobacterium sp. SRCM116780]|uniref:PqqD family protein n=1 Tax=Sphingobacterium sp. SRCM116780 TaxID=2907623 RepID=UPI001F3EE0DB|nr:PqqD family protein [Sphingobacterium sp. SRCM116780]UIR55996.1 PqqD family protein [Sphingobacterium sp. SRCM116780]
MKLRNDLTLRQLGDEYIIVDPSQDMIDMSKVFTLNQSAAFLWEELQGKDFFLGDVVALILDNYEVSQEIAEHDAKQLITSFQEQGLLNVV